MRNTTKVLLSIAVAAAVSSTPRHAVASPAPEVIDLNRASFEELLAFRGIGRLYAAKIVAARPFLSRSELVKRNVIPLPVYLAIKYRLFVTGAREALETTSTGRVPEGMLDLNRASLDELLAVPGIGRAYAAKIVAGRPYRNELEVVGRRIMPMAAFQRVEGRIAVAP